MNKNHSYIYICAFLVAVQVVYGRKCTDDEMVQRNKGKKATCVKCECKGGGLYFDRSVSIPIQCGFVFALLDVTYNYYLASFRSKSSVSSSI